MLSTLWMSAIAMAVQPANAHHPSWPVVGTTAGEVAINPADGSRRELPRFAKGGLVSPDGKTVAFVDSAPEGGQQVFIADVGGGGARPLSKDAVEPRVLAWTPDGTSVLFASGKRGSVRIMAAATRPGDPAPTPMTAEMPWCNDATAAAGGRVAFYCLREVKNKQRIGDVMLTVGSKARVLVADVDAWSLAFSPDGRRLAIGRVGRIDIIDPDHPEKPLRQIDIPGVDKRLYSHLARHMAWSPDGQVLAARLTFAGGRFYSDPKAPHDDMYGDKELFLFPADGGAPIVLNSPSEVRSLRWLPPSGGNGAPIPHNAIDPLTETKTPGAK